MAEPRGTIGLSAADIQIQLASMRHNVLAPMDTKIPNERTKPLFQVSIPIDLMPEHPRYFDLAGGYLQIWIFADNPHDAVTRAAMIVDQLPYKILEEEGMVVCEDNAASDQTEFQKHAKAAYDLGFSMMLNGVPIGGQWRRLSL